MRFSLAVLALLLASTGTRADEPALKGDLAKIQGKWTAQAGPNKEFKIFLTFKGEEVELAFTLPDGQDFKVKGAIRLDEAAKPNKTIDWIKFTSPEGDAVPDNLGIYEFEDGGLKVCSGGPGNERPTEFKAGEGGPPTLVLLTRPKD